MSTSTSSSVNTDVVEELRRCKELCVENFTPERVATLAKQISKAYEPGFGIGATVLSRILFGYQQAIYRYEGIAYHFFNLVATRNDNSSAKRKGTLFFVYAEDAGNTEFPVCESEWHNVADIVSKRKELEEGWSPNSSSLSETSKVSSSEESSLSSTSSLSSSVSNSSVSVVSSVLSELSEVLSKLAKVFSS